MNSSWGKILYIEWCSRKERGGISCLLAGVWQLKGRTRNTDKGICLWSLGEEDVGHMIMDCLEYRNWGSECLNVNRKITYRKMLIGINISPFLVIKPTICTNFSNLFLE